MLAMQEAGIPVTFGYLTTAHNCYTSLDGQAQSTFLSGTFDDYNPGGSVPATNPCNHTDVTGTTDSGTSSSFGSGEQGYVNYLSQLNTDFGTFFSRAATDGYTPSNSVFVLYSDENDHVSEGTPANPTCDGVTTACQYNHSATQTMPTTGQLGEVTVKLDNTFPQGGATSYFALYRLGSGLLRGGERGDGVAVAVGSRCASVRAQYRHLHLYRPLYQFADESRPVYG